MLVDFESLDNSARIWIYQSNREFSTNEMEIINAKVESFLHNWVRHGEDLKASYLMKYNQFIVLAVDEDFNNVSGCSIDASVNLMKQFEKQFSLDLTNKLNISFKDNDNINVVPLADFQKFIKEEKITSKTVVFNNMVATKGDFNSKWEVEAKESWHNRFLAINKA
ncbi:ABC transporter ATPase [Lutibacter sp.]|uniref:ABC transporter ATPase n=1 Tax=Lutibacter sp. TaxID=1925666 RepID=UPI001A244E0B|nr:ABC transporter ATPase [Lutibacter sp.]MBI9042724.1 ABC transporter ATPase [Lutibacter sp.]